MPTRFAPGFITRVAATAALALWIAAAIRAEQPPALKIVVIAGEDAVNIIQQKTAVAPIVEVRDRNDQPVAGAVVSFAIRSGRASFGGARTLSVTTNAVGRAVASSLTPTGTGALQISASAAFQSQTAAAVTITQTNVLTAAQAAALGAGTSGGTGAGGAGGGASGGGTAAGTGGAAGGGGGMSGLTIGAIAGGVGAAALAATQLGGGDSSGSSSAPPPSGPPGGSNAFTPRPYFITFAPTVSSITQCPIYATVPNPGSGAGPFGTNISPGSDGSFSTVLTAGVSGGPSTPVVTIAGRATATDLTATMACIGGGGPTGTITATGTTAQYQGTYSFGNISGTVNVVPQ